MDSSRKPLTKTERFSLLNRKFGYSARFILYPLIGLASFVFLVTFILSFVFPILLLLPLASIGGGGYIYFLWKTTKYIVSEKQIIKFNFFGQESIQIRSITKIRLDAIQGFPFGSIRLETAAQSGASENGKTLQGDLIIANVDNPKEIYDLIIDLMQI
jgi:hypothetical protein